MVPTGHSSYLFSSLQFDGHLRPRWIVFFISFIANSPFQMMPKRLPDTFRLSLMLSPISPPPHMPSFGWLLFELKKRWPSKAKALLLSQFLDWSYFQCHKQENQPQGEHNWCHTPCMVPLGAAVPRFESMVDVTNERDGRRAVGVGWCSGSSCLSVLCVYVLCLSCIFVLNS